jgi:PNKP adenylyltransferase domain, C-terminal region
MVPTTRLKSISVACGLVGWVASGQSPSEFALGMVGLERFVRGEPLVRVRECVFGVLALESEPVDPRL